MQLPSNPWQALRQGSTQKTGRRLCARTGTVQTSILTAARRREAFAKPGGAHGRPPPEGCVRICHRPLRRWTTRLRSFGVPGTSNRGFYVALIRDRRNSRNGANTIHTGLTSTPAVLVEAGFRKRYGLH